MWWLVVVLCVAVIVFAFTQSNESRIARSQRSDGGGDGGGVG